MNERLLIRQMLSKMFAMLRGLMIVLCDIELRNCVALETTFVGDNICYLFSNTKYLLIALTSTHLIGAFHNILASGGH